MFLNTNQMIYRKFPGAIKVLFALASLILIGFISYESLIEVSAQPSIEHLDKLIHFLAYGALTGFLLPALSRVSPLFVVLGTTLFGAGIEIVQGVMGIGRNADLLDGFANFSGAFCALLAWAAISALYKVVKDSDNRSEPESSLTS